MPKVVKKAKDSEGNFIGHSIYCPGCKCLHTFNKSIWSFNGDMEKPTFSPSMLVNKSFPKAKCHSYVEDGKIRFLSDCFHKLKNTTVDLESF